MALVPEIHSLCQLDVFLNGSRNYVQGSQILARTAEAIRRSFGESFSLSEFAFKHTTVNLVGANFSDTDGELQTNSPTLGDATFNSPHGLLRARFVELPISAQRADVPETVILQLAAGGTGGNGSFVFSGASCFEDALRTIVQAVKKLHEALAADARDIWLTGMRAAAIPLDTGFGGEAGEIDIEMMRLMRSPPQYQTLNRIAIRTNRGITLAPFFVTFALRSDRGIDVN